MERVELINIVKKLSLQEKLFLLSQLSKELSSYHISPQKKIVKLKGIIPANSFPNLDGDLEQLRTTIKNHLEEEWKND